MCLTVPLLGQMEYITRECARLGDGLIEDLHVRLRRKDGTERILWYGRCVL